jgi:hypothetical protein
MILSEILPYEKYVLVSLLTPAEIGRRIEAAIEPRNTTVFNSFTRRSTKPYEGEHIGDRFEISRIIDYRNSFLPDISGHITPYGSQTRIAITMHLSPLVLVFMVVWLGTVGSMCLGIIITGSLPLERRLFKALSDPEFTPFGMFIFGCLLAIIPFKIESKKSKRFLANLFDGQEVKDL